MVWCGPLHLAPGRCGINIQQVARKRKEKITPVSLYRCECEPVDHTLIMVFHDAMCGFMPPFQQVASKEEEEEEEE